MISSASFTADEVILIANALNEFFPRHLHAGVPDRLDKNSVPFLIYGDLPARYISADDFITNNLPQAACRTLPTSKQSATAGAP